VSDRAVSAAVALALSGVAYAAVCIASGVAPRAQQPSGPETLYKDSCARCHDQPTGRTPSREALRDRSADAILLSLTSGSMAFQAQHLSAAEKQALAEYLAGKSTAPTATAANLCADRPATLSRAPSETDWNGWGAGASNARYQPTPGLTTDDVKHLRLKWAFGFPGGAQAYGNPAIVAGRVFAGSDAGAFYALDADTGCTYWSFKASAGIRAAPTVAPLGGGRYVVYVGDLKANVYALDAATGLTIWTRTVDDHRFARITGSPTLYGGRLFVPVSSIEEGPGAQPAYPCCTFRGSVVALDATTGAQAWKTYTIAETPQQVGKNSAGTPQWAPAGAAVWNAPTIDPARRALYIGTGNSYTAPAVKTSDAVVALDLETGKTLWWNQVTPADAFIVGCRPGADNCPKDLGPDFDFGNAPILRSLAGGRRILVIGQKSGVAWGLDPDHEGKVVWQVRAGKGTMLGGIEWGSAADEANAYVPVSDVLAPPDQAGGLFALKLATGEQVWHTPAPKLECTGGRGCTGAQSAPVSVMPGVVFSGSVDGHLRAYATADGAILWDYNTVREFDTVNHVPAKGGSIDAAGPAIADGLVVTNSGYALWRGLPGNVLLAFSK
jgi:polyvinyl alcohol dehydrogenase (cytochrome)